LEFSDASWLKTVVVCQVLKHKQVYLFRCLLSSTNARTEHYGKHLLVTRLYNYMFIRFSSFRE